jgi:hypothetical protein
VDVTGEGEGRFITAVAVAVEGDIFGVGEVTFSGWDFPGRPLLLPLIAVDALATALPPALKRLPPALAPPLADCDSAVVLLPDRPPPVLKMSPESDSLALTE